MTKNKLGLGRGLDALINPNFKNDSDESLTVSSSEIKSDDGSSLDFLAKIAIGKIKPNPFQPRTEFDKTALEELKQSILQNGLIQPITVRRIDGGLYELISGERRLRACSEIGYREIPAYIIKVESNEDMLALSLIENIQREKLNPIEIANAYKRLIEECNLSQEEVAARVGKDRTTITNTIRLLKLPEEVLNSIAKGEISAGHARALINLNDPRIQIKLLKKIIAGQYSVRKVEKIVKTISNGTRDEINSRRNDTFSRDKISNNNFENKLRGIFGTKVICRHKKDGSGMISIEYYSNDELERLIELFDLIEKYN